MIITDDKPIKFVMLMPLSIIIIKIYEKCLREAILKLTREQKKS